jgi:hypothetical protein
VADYLKNNDSSEFANIGYYVKNTLSDKGSVKRGVLHSKDGVVESLIESNVERRDDGKIYATPIDLDEWKVIEEDTLVSMNMFGFTDKLMDRLERETKDFFANANLNKAEFLIPEVVDRMVQDGEVRLIVESTPSKWYGITYKEDLEDFKVAVEKMKAEGQYPEHLYSK